MSEGIKLDITGYYESIDTSTGDVETLQLNQGGQLLLGWLQRRVYEGVPAPEGMPLNRTWNQKDAIGKSTRLENFEIKAHYKSQQPGIITFSGELISKKGYGPLKIEVVARSINGIIILELKNNEQGEPDADGHPKVKNQSISFRQTSKQPRLSDAALEYVSDNVKKQLYSDMRPLHTDEEKAIAEVSDKVILALLVLSQKRDFYRIYQVEIVVREEFEKLPEEHRDLAAFATRSRIADIRAENREDLNNWLYSAVDKYPWNTKNIQKYFGIVPGWRGNKIHKYRYSTINAVGAEGQIIIDVGYERGTFYIEKYEPNEWMAVYNYEQKTMGAGAAIGLKVPAGKKFLNKIKNISQEILDKLSKEGGAKVTAVYASDQNEISSIYDYTPEDFIGRYDLFMGKVNLGPVEYSPDWATYMRFVGSGRQPPIEGKAGGLQVVAAMKVGAGLYFSRGALTSITSDPGVKPAANKIITEKQDYLSHQKLCFQNEDQAFLNEIGRSAIRDFCARERSSLSNPETELNFYGHCSDTGTDQYNIDLSCARIENTLTAIRDILGSSFSVKKINKNPMGRTQILKDNSEGRRPEGVSLKEWRLEHRRVDIIVNGHISLTLK